MALAAAGKEARYLAGGQTLVQAMKLRLASPTELIDLSGIAELRAVAADGGRVTIGAMARHAEVAGSSIVRTHIPALSALAKMIGDRQVRHMGTAGGSIANSDPAADYPAAALGLGATIVTDRRRIEADVFFIGLYETALEPNELIVSVSFPIPRRAAYMKFRNPASRFATVGIFVADFGDAVPSPSPAPVPKYSVRRTWKARCALVSRRGPSPTSRSRQTASMPICMRVQRTERTSLLSWHDARLSRSVDAVVGK